MVVEHLAHVAVLLFDDDLHPGAVARGSVPCQPLEHLPLFLHRRRPEVANDEADRRLLAASLQDVRVDEALVAVRRFG